MKLSQAKARLTAIEASVVALRARIARRDERGKGATKAQAADRASLERALSRVEPAKERVGRALVAESKAKRGAAMRVSMERQLDRIAADAPKIDKRWRRDRELEGKRIKKLKRRIEERTTKDYGPSGQPQPDWRQKPIALPPPIQQPIADDPVLVDLPPRDGLIPGTYRTMPDRFGSLLDKDPLPPRWTARHVGQRLMDAFATLRAMPEKNKPKGFGAMWPAYKVEAGEAALQAGTGTLALERNRVRRTASADEVALMDQALGWVSRYCSHFDKTARQWLIFWCDDPDSELDDGRAPLAYFQMIADRLNAANEVVR